MRKPRAVAAASLAVLAGAAAPAPGQVPERDPSAESPAGHVYQLPVDTARSDAAPKRPPGRGGTSTPTDEDSSPPPAAPAAGGVPPAGAPGGAGGDAAAGDGRARPSSAIRSENGFGTSTRVPGVDPPSEVQRAAAPPSDPSGARVFGILALGVLLAGGVGTASRRARFPRAGR
jgi:hypothetical protein